MPDGAIFFLRVYIYCEVFIVCLFVCFFSLGYSQFSSLSYFIQDTLYPTVYWWINIRKGQLVLHKWDHGPVNQSDASICEFLYEEEGR